MSENELSTLLHDRLAALEPPLTITPGQTVHRGRRARRLRTGLVAGGVAVLAVGGVAAVLAGGLGNADNVTVASDPGSAAGIDATILDAAAREYAPHLGALPNDPVTATNDAGQTVPLDSPAATGFGVKYELPGDHSITLSTHAAEPTAISDCTEWDRTGTAVACHVLTLPDGTTVMTSVLAFGPAEGQAPRLPTILDAEHLAEADPSTLSWSRGVTVRTPDGEMSGGYELLPAPSYDAAKAAWQLPTAALVAAATDPALLNYEFD
jgi:hypothetical protein